MRNIMLLIAFLLGSNAYAQTVWGGSGRTGTAFRDGNVVIGNTQIDGSFGDSKVLQIKGDGVWLSMVFTRGGGSTFSIHNSTSYGTGFYSQATPISF